jgi:hypothetical protein
MDDKDVLSLSPMDQGETETIELNNLLTNELTPSWLSTRQNTGDHIQL